jgi:hypothetical protein
VAGEPCSVRSRGRGAHNDAAPYNAVWRDGELIGFIDWDMAGPRRREDDLAWTGFSWVPLHARHVVAAEGFTDFGRRRARLSAFLDSYGSLLTPDEVIARAAVLIDDQIRLMRQRVSAGDATYQRMLEHGRAHALEIAGGELLEIWKVWLEIPATELISSCCACPTNADAALHCLAQLPASTGTPARSHTATTSRLTYPFELPSFQVRYTFCTKPGRMGPCDRRQPR